jgi:hypothetical protein
MTENALTIPEQGGFLALQPANQDFILQLIESTIMGGLQPYQLPAIKGPSGDVQFFTVPTIEGDAPLEEFDAVIVSMKSAHTFYAKSFEESGGGSAPDCASVIQTDESGLRRELGMVGADYEPEADHFDNGPGGFCDECSLGQFGKHGELPRCNGSRILYLLMEGTAMPLQFKITATGLKNIGTFFTGRAAFAEMFNSMVCRFSLEPDKSKATGIKYHRLAEPTRVRGVTPEEAQQVFEISKVIQPWLDKVQVRRAQEAEFDDEG